MLEYRNRAALREVFRVRYLHILGAVGRVLKIPEAFAAPLYIPRTKAFRIDI
jgi:hypothetical protein